MEWKKGAQILQAGGKYQVKQNAGLNELLINKVAPEDGGDYSCMCGDQKTTASIKIRGRKRTFTVGLRTRDCITLLLQPVCAFCVCFCLEVKHHIPTANPALAFIFCLSLCPFLLYCMSWRTADC